MPACFQEAARLLLDADEDIAAALQLERATLADDGASGSDGQASGSSGTVTTGSASLQPSEAGDGSGKGPWLLSSPAWTSVGDPRYVNGPLVSGSNTTLVLDNNPQTHLAFSVEASQRAGATPLWLAWDTGVCVAATGFRVFGSGTVGDVRLFRLSYSTTSINVRASCAVCCAHAPRCRGGGHVCVSGRNLGRWWFALSPCRCCGVFAGPLGGRAATNASRI